MTGWARPPLPARWSSPARPAFVGRRAELAAFEEVWTAVLAGSRQVVFLGGEPGAGKSRLLAEVATTLHRHGAAVLHGGCAAEFGPPYQPFGEPLSAVLPAVGEDRARDRLRTLAGHGPAQDGDSHEHRRSLYDAAVDALRTVAADRPLVLALEDLHWAGPSSLQLLAHLVERTPDCPMLVLGTHRTTAPDRSPALVRTIARLYRLDGVRRVDLAGLSTEDIAEYLVREARLDPRRARTAAPVLRDETGGNPFFLRELARDGRLEPDPDPDRLGRAAPASVRDTILGRLERLTEPQRQTVELAAVVGEDAEVAVVLAASEWSQDTTLAALDVAVAFGLLDAVPPADGALRFPHALSRQAVLDLMPPSRRLQQHARVAAVLEGSIPPSERRTQQLAFHYAQAHALGDAGQAVRYLTQAARDAARGLAHEDAAAWFEQAAALTRDPRERDDLLLSAADSHLLSGDFGRARAQAEQVATSTTDASLRLAAALVYEDASWRPGRPGQRAVELLTEALAGLEPGADHRAVRGRASLGRALAFTGDTERAGALGAAAIGEARARGDDDLLAHALQASLWNGLRPRDAPGKLARATELSRLAHRTGALGHLGPAAYYRGVIAYLQGDPAAVHEAHEDLLRMSRATGQAFFEYMAGCVGYARQFVAGDLAGAQRTCDGLLELGNGFGSEGTEGSSAVQSYLVRRETGAIERVRPLITGNESPDGHWAPGLLALYTELGLVEPTARLLARLLDGGLAPYEDTAQWPCVLAFAVEAALFLEDAEAARALRPRLAEYAGLNLVAGQFVAVFGSAERYLGAVDSLLGLPSADAELAAALEADTRMAAPVHQAHTLAAQVLHARRTGRDPAPPRDRALALARPLGLRRVLRLVEPPVAHRPARGPGGLTARETEVLRLVGEGLINREIAERLVISENTAANHVRSILGKTGAANRTQAALFAAAQGLLD